jgi:hypothetical protein
MIMRDGRPRNRLAYLAGLSGVLFACTPLPQRYQNTVHPQYGDSEYLSDLTHCRNENSAAVVTTVDYLTHSTVRVNEVQAGGCMTRHGWEPVSTADAWSPPLWRWAVW